MPRQAVADAKQLLADTLQHYLAESDVERVLHACDFADTAHGGVIRKSGEP